MLARLLAAIPSQCAVCASWQGQALCTPCIERFAPAQPRCQTCALPTTGGAERCGECLRHPPPLDACVCAVAYAYPWSDCIARYKFRQQPGWAGALAAVLRRAPGAQAMLARCDRVLPMPLSPQRLRERGFNQALEIARRLAPGKTDAHTLLRIRDTAPQRALGVAERARNVRGAFALAPSRAAQVQGLELVLLDDVMTSGASLFAAARTLREAGALGVRALVLARTAKS